MGKDIFFPNSAGRKITFSPQAEADKKVLRQAAKSGYYYPMIALKQLGSLSSGLDKMGVYIPDIIDSKAKTFQRFAMVLPGIEAHMEKRANGGIYVSHFVLSDEYKSIASGDDKPGIYEIESLGEKELIVKRKTNEQIKPIDDGLVIVKGVHKGRAKDAAEETYKWLRNNGYKRIRSFDILFCPGKQSFNKGQAYDARYNVEAMKHAGYLAKAMEGATKRKGTSWVSELDGSAVLTQAMQMLAIKGVNFENQLHTVSLYKPKSSPAQALKLVNQLGMKPEKNFVVKGDIRAKFSSAGTLLGRARRGSDSYDYKALGVDVAKGAIGVSSMAGAAFFVVSAPAAIATLSAGGAIAVGSLITGGIGTTYFGLTQAKKVIDRNKV